LLYIY